MNGKKTYLFLAIAGVLSIFGDVNFETVSDALGVEEATKAAVVAAFASGRHALQKIEDALRSPMLETDDGPA